VQDIVAGLRLRRQGEKWIPCRLCLTADIALRLGLYFGMGPCFWINLQVEYDLRTRCANCMASSRPRSLAFHPAVV